MGGSAGRNATSDDAESSSPGATGAPTAVRYPPEANSLIDMCASVSTQLPHAHIVGAWVPGELPCHSGGMRTFVGAFTVPEDEMRQHHCGRSVREHASNCWPMGYFANPHTNIPHNCVPPLFDLDRAATAINHHLGPYLGTEGTVEALDAAPHAGTRAEGVVPSGPLTQKLKSARGNNVSFAIPLHLYGHGQALLEDMSEHRQLVHVCPTYDDWLEYKKHDLIILPKFDYRSYVSKWAGKEYATVGLGRFRSCGIEYEHDVRPVYMKRHFCLVSENTHWLLYNVLDTPPPWGQSYDGMLPGFYSDMVAVPDTVNPNLLFPILSCLPDSLAAQSTFNREGGLGQTGLDVNEPLYRAKLRELTGAGVPSPVLQRYRELILSMARQQGTEVYAALLRNSAAAQRSSGQLRVPAQAMQLAIRESNVHHRAQALSRWSWLYERVGRFFGWHQLTLQRVALFFAGLLYLYRTRRVAAPPTNSVFDAVRRIVAALFRYFFPEKRIESRPAIPEEARHMMETSQVGWDTAQIVTDSRLSEQLAQSAHNGDEAYMRVTNPVRMAKRGEPIPIDRSAVYEVENIPSSVVAIKLIHAMLTYVKDTPRSQWPENLSSCIQPELVVTKLAPLEDWFVERQADPVLITSVSAHLRARTVLDNADVAGQMAAFAVRVDGAPPITELTPDEKRRLQDAEKALVALLGRGECEPVDCMNVEDLVRSTWAGKPKCELYCRKTRELLDKGYRPEDETTYEKLDAHKLCQQGKLENKACAICHGGPSKEPYTAIADLEYRLSFGTLPAARLAELKFDGEMAAAVAAACRKTQGVRAIRFSEWDPCFALAMRKGPAARMKQKMTPDSNIRVYSSSKRSWTTLKFVWSSGMSQRDISAFLSSMGENTFCGADLSRFDMSTWKDLDEAVCRVIDKIIPLNLRKQYRYTENAYRNPRVQARNRAFRLLLEYLTKYESASGRFWTSERGTLIHFLIVHSGLQAALDVLEQMGHFFTDYGQYWVMAMGDDSVHTFSIPHSVFAEVMLRTYGRYSYKVKPEWGDRTSLAYCGMVAVHAPDGSISMLPGPSFCASFPKYFQDQGKSQLVFAGMRTAAQTALEHYAAMMPCGGWAYIVASLMQPDGSCPFTFAEVSRYRELILEGQYGPQWRLQYETTVEHYILCGHILHGDEEACIEQVKRYCKRQTQPAEPRARLRKFLALADKPTEQETDRALAPAGPEGAKGVTQAGRVEATIVGRGTAFSIGDAARALYNRADARLDADARLLSVAANHTISVQLTQDAPPMAEVEISSDRFWLINAALETIACLAHPVLLTTTVAFDCGLHAALGVRLVDLAMIGLHHYLLANTHKPLALAARTPLGKVGFLVLAAVEILTHAAHNAAVEQHWRNALVTRRNASLAAARMPAVVYPSEVHCGPEAIAAERRVQTLESLQGFVVGAGIAYVFRDNTTGVFLLMACHIIRNTLRVAMRITTARIHSHHNTLPDPFYVRRPPTAAVGDALRSLLRAAPSAVARQVRGVPALAAPARDMLVANRPAPREFLRAVYLVVRRFFLVLIAVVQRRVVVAPVARAGPAVARFAAAVVNTPINLPSVSDMAQLAVHTAVSSTRADAVVARAAIEGAASAVDVRSSVWGLITAACRAVRRLAQYRLRVRITGPPTNCVLCAARRYMRPHFNWLDSEQQPIARDAAEGRALVANVQTIRILAQRLGTDIAREMVPFFVELHNTEGSLNWSPDYVCMAQSSQWVYPYLRTLRESVGEHADHRLMLRAEPRAPLAVLRGFLASVVVDAPSSAAALRTRREGPVAITHRFVTYADHRCLEPLERVQPLRPLRSPALTFLAGLLYCSPDSDGPTAVIYETAVFTGGVGRVQKHILISTPHGHLVYWKPPRCYVDFIQVYGLRASGLNTLSAALRRTRAFGCLVLRLGLPSAAPPDPYRSWLAQGYAS